MPIPLFYPLHVWWRTSRFGFSFHHLLHHFSDEAWAWLTDGTKQMDFDFGELLRRLWIKFVQPAGLC